MNDLEFEETIKEMVHVWARSGRISTDVLERAAANIVRAGQSTMSTTPEKISWTDISTFLMTAAETLQKTGIDITQYPPTGNFPPADTRFKMAEAGLTPEDVQPLYDAGIVDRIWPNSYDAEVPVSDMVRYYNSIGVRDGSDMVAIHRMEISGIEDHVTWNACQRMLELAPGIRFHARYVAHGSSGVVFRVRNELWKLSCGWEKRNEVEIAERIRKNVPDARNIMLAEPLPRASEKYPRYATRMDVIPGRSLDTILQEDGILNPENILKYAAGIANGLCELRRAGIFYHRDIRPANIMIDEVHDEAIIIDYGVSADNRHAMAQWHEKYEGPANRRYGGANDLVSLGQVMYKMATGDHLFKKSRTMTETVAADSIRDHRSWVFESPRRVRYYLDKVRRTVKDEKVADVICTLLTAKNYHYGKTKRYLEKMIA